MQLMGPWPGWIFIVSTLSLGSIAGSFPARWPGKAGSGASKQAKKEPTAFCLVCRESRSTTLRSVVWSRCQTCSPRAMLNYIRSWKLDTSSAHDRPPCRSKRSFNHESMITPDVRTRYACGSPHSTRIVSNILASSLVSWAEWARVFISFFTYL
jgi:hypothetical protein